MNVLEVERLIQGNSRSAAGFCSARSAAVRAVAGCELRHRARGNAGAGRRERLRQDHGRRAASCARCRRPRRDPLLARGGHDRRHGAAVATRLAAVAASHPDDLSGSRTASLNPRMMVGDIIAEPLLVNGVPAAQRTTRVRELLDLVGLPPECANALSARLQRRPAPAHRHRARAGARSRAGRRRRAGIRARCLGAGPDHQSAAGPAGPARAVDAVRRARSRRGAPCQRPRRRDVCRPHRRDSRRPRRSTRDRCILTPRRCWRRSQSRSGAARSASPRRRGEVADPSNPPPGCAFHPRCPYAQDRCRVELPVLREIAPAHWSACHRAAELSLRGVA